MAFELALIGYPLSHSHSAEFFNKKFDLEGIEARYFNAKLSSIDELPSLLEEHPSLLGFNVTAPYKEAVMPYLDALSPEARAIGAVNTVKIVRSATPRSKGMHLTGYNTDCSALRSSLSHFLKREGVDISNGLYALILGTGGASKAAVQACRALGIESALVSRMRGRGRYTYDDLSEKIMSRHRLIINTTPLGTYPDVNEAPDIPYSFISHAHACFDLVYNPPVSLFLKKAREGGAVICNGAEMLRLQALEAYEIWTADGFMTSVSE